MREFIDEQEHIFCQDHEIEFALARIALPEHERYLANFERLFDRGKHIQ